MSTEAPLLSVTIATYNRARSLDRAIRSALSQTGDFFEVVVGDDASPDDTPAVIATHQADPRLRAYRNERNLGLQANVQNVVRAARGDYIFILTDDDVLLPRGLLRAAEVIREYPQAGYILSHLPSVDERSGEITHWHRTFRHSGLHPAGLKTVERVASSAWVLSRQILRRDCVDWSAWERFGQNIYFPIIVAGRLMLNAPCYYLAEPLVHHTFFNQVFWQAFGRDQLEIEFNLAADRYHCMAAILSDQPDSAEARAVCARWELGSFLTYLNQPYGGFYDLLKALGPRRALERLRTVYPLTARQVFALAVFALSLPVQRTATRLKAGLRQLPPPLLARLRLWRDRLRSV